MKIVIMTTAICLCVATLAPANPPTTASTQSPASGTRYSARQIAVYGVPQFSFPLITSDDLLGVLKKSAVDIAPQFGLDVTKAVSSIHVSDRNGLSFSVLLPPDQPAVSKLFANALCNSLHSPLLARIMEKSKQAIEDSENQKRKNQAESDAANKKIENLQGDVKSLSGQFDTSQNSIKAAGTRLQDRLDELKLNILGKKARQEALQQAIADCAKKVDATVSDDPIAKELQKVVDDREKKAKYIAELVSVGKATPGEADEANATLAEATAKLLQRRHDAALEAGNDVVQGFNRDLLNLSIDLRELSARLEFVNQSLDKLRQTNSELDTIAQLSNDVARLEGINTGLDQWIAVNRDLPQDCKNLQVSHTDITDSSAMPEEFKSSK